MRVLVFSDTHGKIDRVLKVLKKEKADLILHAGDFYRDALALGEALKLPVTAVAGNCDAVGSGPEEQILTLKGKKILLAHGHQQGVKRSYNGIFYRAKECQADAVVFGHTHVPLNEVEQGILMFNPGSISRPVPGNAPSYGLLQITEQMLEGHILYL